MKRFDSDVLAGLLVTGLASVLMLGYLLIGGCR